MNDKRDARQRIRLLWDKIEAEAHGVPNKEVPLLDEIISICDTHKLTHHDCIAARDRLAKIGDAVASRARQVNK
jgi:hypothetical protein